MEKVRDNSNMGLEKTKFKKEVILETQRDNKRLHFDGPTLFKAHLRHRSLLPKSRMVDAAMLTECLNLFHWDVQMFG